MPSTKKAIKKVKPLLSPKRIQMLLREVRVQHLTRTKGSGNIKKIKMNVFKIPVIESETVVSLNLEIPIFDKEPRRAIRELDTSPLILFKVKDRAVYSGTTRMEKDKLVELFQPKEGDIMLMSYAGAGTARHYVITPAFLKANYYLQSAATG